MSSVEIVIKGRDLISANGYFQSNRDHWHTSGWLTTLDRVAVAWCGRRGSAMAGAARAHRSSALHGYGAPFFVVFLPMEPAGCEELTMGVFNWWGAPDQDVWGRAQASAFGNGTGKLQGMAHEKVGQNGCGAGCRTPTSG
jgi:hypothetical protein